MSDNPKIYIYLSGDEIKVVGDELVGGRKPDDSYRLNWFESLDNVHSFGEYVLRILRNWHPNQFTALEKADEIDQQNFSDYETVSRLIYLSVQRKSRVYASAIDELLQSHISDGVNNTTWEALNADWIKMQKFLPSDA